MLIDKKGWIIICLLLGGLSLTTLSAQLRIQPAFTGEDGLKPADLWRLQLQWLGSGPLVVSLVSEVKNEKGGLLFQRESQTFILEPGFQRLHPENLRVDRMIVNDTPWREALRAAGAFPGGKYEICTMIFTADGRSELARHCEWVEIPDAGSTPPDGRLRFSGSAQLDYVYSNRSWPGSQFPQQFIRADLHPRFDWQGIPLHLDVFLTTEDQQLGNSMDAVSLNFDAAQFRERLAGALREQAQKKARQWQEQHEPAWAQRSGIKQELQALQEALPEEWEKQLRQLEAGTEERAVAQLQSEWEHYRAAYGDPKQALDEQISRLTGELADQKQQDTSRTARGASADLQARIDSLQQARQQWLTTYRQAWNKYQQLQQQYDDLQRRQRQIRQLQQQQRQYRQQSQRQAYLQRQLERLPAVPDSSVWSGLEADQLDDPAYLRQKLRGSGLLTQQRSWLLAVDRLSIGAHFPDFSPLILGGSRVNGLLLGLRPHSRFQVSVSGGSLQSNRYRQAYFPREDRPSGRVLGGKISWQLPRVGEVYLTGVSITERDTFQVDRSDLSQTSSVLGYGLRLQALNNRLSGRIEGAFTPQKGDDPLMPGDHRAYQTELQWSNTAGSLNARLEAQSIGRAYDLPGTPFILPGMQQLDAQINGRVFRQRLQLGLFYQKDDNRPVGFSPFRFQNHQYGLSMEWRQQPGPELALRFARNLPAQSQEKGRAYLCNARISQSYALGALQLESRISYQQSQQQWNFSLPPAMFSYLEARQSVQWSAWTNNWSFYLGKNGQSGRFSGWDWQSSLQLGSRLMLSIQAGYYRGLIDAENGRRGSCRLEWAMSPQLSWQLSGYLDDFFAGSIAPYRYLQLGVRGSW